MKSERIKFTTTFDRKLLEEFRTIALKERMPVSKLLEELMKKYLDEKLNQ